VEYVGFSGRKQVCGADPLRQPGLIEHDADRPLGGGHGEDDVLLAQFRDQLVEAGRAGRVDRLSTELRMPSLYR
jgi:hypothetical protein